MKGKDWGRLSYYKSQLAAVKTPISFCFVQDQRRFVDSHPTHSWRAFESVYSGELHIAMAGRSLFQGSYTASGLLVWT